MIYELAGSTKVFVHLLHTHLGAERFSESHTILSQLIRQVTYFPIRRMHTSLSRRPRIIKQSVHTLYPIIAGTCITYVSQANSPINSLKRVSLRD